jgi:hypothetical protein
MLNLVVRRETARLLKVKESISYVVDVTENGKIARDMASRAFGYESAL